MILDKSREKSERAREYLENGQYREAASAFISLGDYASAARALVCAKSYREAAQCYEKANKPLDAAKLYLLVKEWEKAAKLFSTAGDEMRAEIAREQLRKEGHKVEKTQTKINLPPVSQKDEEKEIWPQGDIFKALQAGEMNIAVNLYLKPGAPSGWTLLQENMSRKPLSALAEMFLMARDYAIAGDTFKKLGNERKAAECLSLAGLYEEAADMFVRCGEKNLAAQNLEKAHQWQKAATIHTEVGNFVEAARCYEKLDDPVKAAGMYLKAQKSDLALPLLQSVQPSHPAFPQCRLLAGKILFQKGQRELALSLLAPLAEYDTLSDTSLDVLYQLAGLMEFGEEFEKAKEVYQKIQQTRFGYKDVEERIRNLKNASQRPKASETQKFSIKKEEENIVDTSPLRDCSLLDKLTLDDLRKLYSSGVVLEPQFGEVILKKGEYSKGLYIILHGGLSISSDPNNLKVAVGFLGKGDYVGLGALVQGPPQPNSLVAQKNTKILFIPKEKLEHLISTELELGLRLYRSIAEHLVNTMMKMSQRK